MESIAKDTLFEFNPDTLIYLRKQYDLDKPGRIEDAIGILEEWLKKQEHFAKKEYSKDYLERIIIISKGSVERAKNKIDNICTYRTLYPEYFTKFESRNSQLLEMFYGGFLPKLTRDHYRVYVVKNRINKPLKNGYIDFYRYFFMQCEYIQTHDYCNGLLIFIDITEANILESMKCFNLTEFRSVLEILREGYGMRIKGIHFYTESKAIDTVVSIFKQAVGPKIATRIHVHNTLDKAYNHLPQNILPIEYGGTEKPLLELHGEHSTLMRKLHHYGLIDHISTENKMKDVVTSTEFSNYLEEMSKACTIEHLRQGDAVNGSHYMGISGTFRNLSVD